ncbi:unnamed protein product [Prunus armeniaca]|uniref:PUB domain-containing protein n=1 Tax=Prunus armeniaca TaxID=36596 RepID=A0A6J5Y7F5_PRUAR|nr:unnamed protein product [Prunus armeniaca]CAB4319454.1 unnamed protein product [Prunus armeniaca]
MTINTKLEYFLNRVPESQSMAIFIYRAVRMVTGDNLQTAKAIALECGILADDKDATELTLIEANVFRELSDREREDYAEKISLERRVNLGLPPEQLVAEKRTPAVRIEQNPFPVRSVAKSECMRECLRSLRRNHKDDDARVRQAFQTLLIYVGNVARNPNEEKFRKIRLSNPLFLDRVGSLIGGIEFLELCGFETTEGGDFLYLPHNKVDMATLNSAASELKSALTNPFFGLL